MHTRVYICRVRNKNFNMNVWIFITNKLMNSPLVTNKTNTLLLYYPYIQMYNTNIYLYMYIYIAMFGRLTASTYNNMF